jgi:hypothetical protein
MTDLIPPPQENMSVVEEQERALKSSKVLNNAIPLANIIEISTSVILKMAGKDIADVINDTALNRSMLSNLVANRIKEKILY